MTMQKYRNDVSDGWIFKQELRLFKNFLRNWDRDVDDSDFFTIFANSNNTDAEEEKTMLDCHFCAVRLAGIRNLAPGDFRTVRQSLYYLGGDASNAIRLDGLEKESALKKGTSRPLGF